MEERCRFGMVDQAGLVVDHEQIGGDVIGKEIVLGRQDHHRPRQTLRKRGKRWRQTGGSAGDDNRSPRRHEDPCRFGHTKRTGRPAIQSQGRRSVTHAQQVADPGKKEGRVAALGQHIIRTRAQSRDPRVILTVGGERDHGERGRRAPFADGCDERESPFLAACDIKKNEIDPVLGKTGQRLGRCPAGCRLVIGTGDQRPQADTLAGRRFDNQDMAGHDGNRMTEHMARISPHLIKNPFRSAKGS